MLLVDVENMLLERPVDPATGANYRRSVRFFGDHLERPAERSDLREPIVNRFLASVAAVRSSATVLGHKRSLTAVWNWLAEQRLVDDYHARRLRRVSLVTPPPRAWSLDQIRQLLEAAGQLPGQLAHGCTAAQLMTAWVLVGYETGLRPSDLRVLRPADIAGGVITLTQHKTNRPHVCTLSPLALEALRPLLATGSATVFPPRKTTMRRWELRLFKFAEKFGFVRLEGQALGTLRKTNATEVCRRDGLDAAARSLGHVSGSGIAKRYYVAPDAIATTPTPPALYAIPKPDRPTR
jgi:integrase